MQIRRSRLALTALAVVALTGTATMTGIALGDEAPASQFTVFDGAIRKATGVPAPASGTQASLWSNKSYAVTTIEGSGRVLIGAIGDNCEGWPTVRGTVDGKDVGATTIVSSTHYGTYGVGAVAVGPGRHTVRLSFVNDRYEGGCDRNVHIGYARMEHTGTGPASPTVSPTVRPSTSTSPRPSPTPSATRSPTASPTPTSTPPAGDTKFSFAVYPDTQQEVLRAGDTRFKNRSQYLVTNKASLDLRFVTGTGDVVNWDTPDHAQYQVAQDAMRPLEAAGVPYSLALGNHDTQAVTTGGGARDPKRTRQLVRDTSVFDRYFTASQFGGVTGTFESGKVDNQFSVYSAGGVSWLVMTLELWPRTEVVTWARNVVATHPRSNVIIATHSYLNSDGSIYQGSDYGANSPQYLYDNLVSQYTNIKFVFSGHVGNTANRVDTGVHGNKIYSFLQCLHSNTTNPVRLVEVDTRANSLRTWVYGPFDNSTYAAADRTVTGLDLVR